MGRRKRKLTSAEKRAKAERRAQFMTIFVHGKQKRVRRPQVIAGLAADAFILRNADPIWLHQNEIWEDIGTDPNHTSEPHDDPDASSEPDDDEPF